MRSSQNTVRSRADIVSNIPSDMLPPPDFRLRALGLEHDDLDAAIAALLQAGGWDDLLITRLKKRKLQLRDEIMSVMARGEVPPDAVAQAS